MFRVSSDLFLFVRKIYTFAIDYRERAAYKMINAVSLPSISSLIYRRDGGSIDRSVAAEVAEKLFVRWSCAARCGNGTSLPFDRTINRSNAVHNVNRRYFRCRYTAAIPYSRPHRDSHDELSLTTLSVANSRTHCIGAM